MPGTGWALCCHCRPRHYCFIPLNCWEPVNEAFGSSTRPPPRLAGGEGLDSASPTAAPLFLFLASDSSTTFCLQGGFHRSGNAWKALLWKIPWRQTSHVFPTQTVSPPPWSQLAGSCKGQARTPASRCKGQEPVASVKFFFFPQSIVFFKHPSFETQLEESKITHLQGIPPHCYKLTYALPFKLNLKQFFWKHKNYFLYLT